MVCRSNKVSSDVLHLFALRSKGIKANFQSILSKTTFVSVTEVSFYFYREVFFIPMKTLLQYYFNILRNSDIHSCNTRRRNNFRLALAKRNYGKQRLFYHCAKEWNILDASFKDIKSLLLFKQNIKSYFLGYFIAFNILIYLTF